MTRSRLRIVGVVQARLSSARFPGKVLRPLAGRPLLSHLLTALATCHSLDGVILATSTEPSDDAIAEFAAASGVACHRGSLDDVAQRLLDAAAGADAFVRLSGDSPLLDPRLVDVAVERFREQPTDLVTNVAPRTFPKGQSVELIARGAMQRALNGMTTAAEREHVTAYLYAHPEAFSILGFIADPPRPEVQLSVDEPADLRRCEAILRLLGRSAAEAGWRACVDAYDAIATEVGR